MRQANTTHVGTEACRRFSTEALDTGLLGRHNSAGSVICAVSGCILVAFGFVLRGQGRKEIRKGGASKWSWGVRKVGVSGRAR